MIEPKEEDIGKKVIYKQHWDDYGQRWEIGKVTSFNEHYVFVQYYGDNHSKSTKKQDLTWFDKDAMHKGVSNIYNLIRLGEEW